MQLVPTSVDQCAWPWTVLRTLAKDFRSDRHEGIACRRSALISGLSERIDAQTHDFWEMLLEVRGGTRPPHRVRSGLREMRGPIHHPMLPAIRSILQWHRPITSSSHRWSGNPSQRPWESSTASYSLGADKRDSPRSRNGSSLTGPLLAVGNTGPWKPFLAKLFGYLSVA